MQFIYIPLLFLLGAVFGSFFNVVIERLIHGASLRGRSKCDACDHVLAPQELIPIFSFIILRGKCKHCHNKISVQHLLLELTYGTMFVVVYLLLQQGLFLENTYLHNPIHIDGFKNLVVYIYYIAVISGLLALFTSDLKYFLLPDKIMLPLIALVVTYKIISLAILTATSYSQLHNSDLGQNLIDAGWFTYRIQDLISPLVYSLAGALAISLFFLTLIVITKGRGMGAGDVKLGFLIGLLAGWPHMILAIIIGFLTGSLTSLILMIGQRKNLKSRIPFGPFLIIGTLLVLFFGDQLFNYYLQLLGLENAY